jgi:phage gpG-like protein
MAARGTGGGFRVDFDPEPYILASQFFLAGSRIRSLREPIKKAIKEVVAPAFVRNFAAGGRPKWTPLAEATIEWRKEEGHSGAAPLIRSRRLMRTAGQQNIWNIDGRAGEAEARLEDLPSHSWYGIVHQHGWDTGASIIPQRQWAVITADEADAVAEVIGNWVQTRIETSLLLKMH